jgi:myosin I
VVLYVRCIKPNDTKTARQCDEGRVKHQVQYLGLRENVLVRRAGFAYRAEYHRFFDRFKYISSETFPREWTGTDKAGARAIVQVIIL